MTGFHVLTTVLGGFLLPFFILLIWGRLVRKWRAFGGIVAAFLIIGPIWLLNHGLEEPLIQQTGHVFVDMGFATAIGVFVYGALKGGNIQDSRNNLIAVILGGGLAGLFLWFLT